MHQKSPESTKIEEKIASLGSQHLVVEQIITEYIKKPTLVYITFWDTFWDGDLTFTNKTNTGPEHEYGNVPTRDRPRANVRCMVKNYKTAFAPLLANKDMMKLYKRVRIPWTPVTKPNNGNLSLYPRYETRNISPKPIDYHFLENFHRTNARNAEDINLMMLCNMDPYSDLSKHEWWPNIVVRMSELWEVMKDWDLTRDSPPEWKLSCYKVFFGVLANWRVKLQDYFILIDRKEHNKRTREHYDAFKNDDANHNRKLLEGIKSYDVMEKLPGDLTFASPEDFDEEQRIWASQIEKCIGAWDVTLHAYPVNAYFVRWKTEEELEEENNQPNTRPFRVRSGLGGRDKVPEKRFDLLHQSPVNYYFTLG
ncbi:hypothetical protein F4823DRAFT_561500 [Ustulina deusta]|nr:hypothetical protein F4823DRAFT_561500 [Ustulina deusta]